MKRTVFAVIFILIIFLLPGCRYNLEEKNEMGDSNVNKEERVNSQQDEKLGEIVQKETVENTSEKVEQVIIQETTESIEEVEQVITQEEPECQKNVKVNQETVEIEPEKEEELIENAQKKLIATGRTNFNPNQVNRSTNVRLAASYINGIILKQGEEFSFNNVVGRRTAERGFLLADVFSGNQVVKGRGGGVCQTSTTLCIAVKQTSMQILEQNPHSMRVSYAKYEDEAMINYGTSDFRFLNTYDVPITIEFLFEESSDREIIICNIYKLE